MNKKIIITIISFLLPLINAFGINETVIADSAYNSGDYATAIQLYEKVMEEHGVSASLYYNLGNSYLQSGDVGNAMICYERAYKLKPSDKLIKNNLNYLREKVEDANKAEQRGKRLKVTEDEDNFFRGLQKSISQDTASNTWAIWAVITFLLFATCVVMYLFTTGELLRKTGFFGGLILLGISMICVVFAYMGASSFEEKDYGIITSYKVTLQTEPSGKEDKTKGEILTRGTKIRIVSEEVDAEGNVTWYKVRLNSDYNGWIRSKDLEVI